MKLLIAGAGGHAKVVVDAALACGLDIAGVLGRPGDADSVLGVPVAHDRGLIDADSFIVAVGDNRTRMELFTELEAAGLAPASVVHPSAVIAPSASIGRGAFIAAGVVVNPDATIADNAILNTGCTVDHDCVVGVHAHVGPGVNLCGNVTVGESALLGVGSCAMPGTRIGEGTIVGAGAAVTSDLPSSTTCVGVPAKPLPEKDGRP